MKQKKIIGITGGVGAGKSSVLAVLKNDFGAKIILADLVAHDLMEPGSLGLRKVTEALGTSFLTPDGAVDRKALGGPIIIKTVDGQVEYEVKAGTQTDTKVRLKGKGVPSLRNKAVRGDHYVTLVVQVPDRMNEEQRQALRRFDELMTGKITKEDEGHKKKGFFSK